MSVETNRGLEFAYILVADGVRFEIRSKLTVLGLFDTIITTELPFVQEGFAVITAYRNVELKLPHEIQIWFDETDEKIGSFSSYLNPSEGIKISRTVIQVKGFKFEKEGRYSVRSVINGETLGESYLFVEQRPSLNEE